MTSSPKFEVVLPRLIMSACQRLYDKITFFIDNNCQLDNLQFTIHLFILYSTNKAMDGLESFQVWSAFHRLTDFVRLCCYVRNQTNKF